jgi:uncharacterized protein
MNLKLVFIFAIFSSQSVAAQHKPIYSTDFTNSFYYQLPKEFSPNDSLQLSNEITIIASNLLRWQDSAVYNFTFNDSVTLYNILDGRIAAEILLHQNQSAIETIIRTRRIQPAPYYNTPNRFTHLAYARACLQKPDDGSNTFANLLSASFKQEFEMLNKDFRNDLINRYKGIFTAATAASNQKAIKRLFEQSQKNNGGKLNYDNTIELANTYYNFMLQKNHYQTLQRLLYELDPQKTLEEKVKIPMRDSIKLNAYVFRNTISSESVPAIVSLSPYPSGSEALRGNVFATNGYVYVYVDNRGRRESEGNFFPYEDDARDYYDIIDWVSKQPWCNGKVATSGGSYLGFAQWQAIRSKFKHPALKAINPMVSVGFGIDFPRYNHMFYPYILRWANYVSGKELNTASFNDASFWQHNAYLLYKNNLPFNKLDSVAGLPNPFFQKWLSHPDFDNYWSNTLPNQEDYSQIDIPVLSITGYYDSDQNGAMYYYNNHMKYGNPTAKNNHYLLIGPYEHGDAQWLPRNIQNDEGLETAAQIPIYKYAIWWFDWVLKGKQKPAFIKDKITYFETGSNEWKGTTDFDKISKDSIVFYITSTTTTHPLRKSLNMLSTKRPTQQKSISYKQDITFAKDSAFVFAESTPFSDSLYLTSPYNLVFETPILKNDIIVTNKIIANIYMQLNVPDADFNFTIYEIAPDGKSRSIAEDASRVRYRMGGDKPQLAKPGENILLKFDNAFIYVKKINKGSKLRLEFQLINSPWHERNYGFGGVVNKESTHKPRIIEAKIMTGGKSASNIVIPISNK